MDKKKKKSSNGSKKTQENAFVETGHLDEFEDIA